MFKHLLEPVDGSDVSKKSLKKVAELAKVDKASVTLVYVSDPMPLMIYSDSTMGYGITQKDHQKVCAEYAADVFKKLLLHWDLVLKRIPCIFLIAIYQREF